MTLVDKLNEFKSKLERMSEKERDEYVEKVIDWLIEMFERIRETAERDGYLKAMQLAQQYRKVLSDEDVKAKVIVCLTYCIKEKYQRKLAPLIVGMLGFV